jgi:AcrR family transcriptional regulator
MVTSNISTPAKILRAAQHLMLASGEAGLRVDAVAAAANLNKRLIYHYFGNREGLVQAVLRQQVNVLLAPGGVFLSEPTRRVLTLYLADLYPEEPGQTAQRDSTLIADEQTVRRAFHLILPVLLRYQEQQRESIKMAAQFEWPSRDRQQIALDLMRLLFPQLGVVEESSDKHATDSERSLTSPKPRYRMASASRPAG